MPLKKIILIFLLFSPIFLWSQLGNSRRVPSYFGIYGKAIIPSSLTGSPILTVSKDGMSNTITQELGYSFGGSVRAGITKLIAFETGINFTQRNFNIDIALVDSNLSAKNTLGFIQYDIPLNGLIYIQMTKKWYLNASLGAAVGFKPTNVGVINLPGGPHTFYSSGFVKHKTSIDINGNFGIEYRTKKSGFFNLGASVRIPTSPLFQYVAVYKNQGYRTAVAGDVNGSYITLDLKYFLPSKRGGPSNLPRGPIE